MKCKKIQEKEEISLKLQNKKKQKLKEKGITLIALVVTIIILLILAGVTLNMALSGDGLFSRARQAAEKYKKAQKDEQDLISEIGKEMYSEYVGAYVTGYEPTGGNITITQEQSGADSPQTFTTDEEGNLKWRIWDYDGTTLRIILDRPTTQTLTLKGADGYNNGVWAINEICRQCFGQYEGNNDTKKMKEGINVANLRRSDIQKVITYDYTKFSHKPDDWHEATEDNEENFHYGEICEMTKYEGNLICPKIWKENDKYWTYEYRDGKHIGDDKECLKCEEERKDIMDNNNEDKGVEDTLCVKTSGWGLVNQTRDKNYFKDQKYFELIDFQNGKGEKILQCWVSTRQVSVYEDSGDFDICVISDKGDETSIGAVNIMNFDGSEGNESSNARSLLPVVSINMEKLGCSLGKDASNNSYKLNW